MGVANEPLAVLAVRKVNLGARWAKSLGRVWGGFACSWERAVGVGTTIAKDSNGSARGGSA